MQDSLNLLDTNSSFAFKVRHPKFKSRKVNDDVSMRTKADYTNQNVGSRTRSKMQCMCNSTVQNFIFSLYDAILSQGHGNFQNNDLQLGVLECKAYNSVSMDSKSQIEFDCLRQIHELGMAENENDMSWKCSKGLDYCEEREADCTKNHICLVEWKDINKSQSWVNFFALSLSNPTPRISFARNNNFINNMPFCHLIKHYKSKSSVDISGTQKVSPKPTSIKYKFGIQVPKGIKNAIEFENKN